MHAVLKSTLVSAFGLLGAMAGPAAYAGGHVQWTVTVGAPVLTLPVPVLHLPVPHRVIVAPVLHVPHAQHATRVPPVVVVVVHGPGHWREPTRWDVDGDGIPNRHDHVYNPAWDRNGNGVPDRREAHHRPYGDRDHDGIPNRYDRRDDRYGHYDGYGRGAREPRHDRHDDRYVPRRQPH